MHLDARHPCILHIHDITSSSIGNVSSSDQLAPVFPSDFSASPDWTPQACHGSGSFVHWLVQLEYLFHLTRLRKAFYLLMQDQSRSISRSNRSDSSYPISCLNELSGSRERVPQTGLVSWSGGQASCDHNSFSYAFLQRSEG